jgi:ankyrin repeat protein
LPSAGAIAAALRQGKTDEATYLYEKNNKSLKHPINKTDVYDVLTELAFFLRHSQGYGGTLTGIRWCVERGADVNAINGTPIWAAAGSDKYEKGLKRLLDYGANPNLQFLPRGTALVAAIRGPRPANATDLIRHRNAADPNLLSGKEKILPLAEAVRLNRLELIKSFGDFNRDYEAVKELYLKYKRPEDAYYKKWTKVNPDAREGNRNTALHVAVLSKNDTACTLLLEIGARWDLKDAKGRTPLQLAQKLGYKDVVKTLKVVIEQEKRKRKPPSK